MDERIGTMAAEDAMFICMVAKIMEAADEDATLKGARNAAAEMLTDRERQVLSMRARGMTQEDIGSKMGVVKERVRQLEARAAEKLEYAAQTGRYAGVRERELREAKARAAKAEERLDWILRNANISIELPPEEDVRQKLGENRAEKREWPLGMPVTAMCMSVRTTNCLLRAGINTAGEVAEIESPTALMKLRNFGKGSYREVLAKMHELGLKMKWETVEWIAEEDADGQDED